MSWGIRTKITNETAATARAARPAVATASATVLCVGAV